MKKLLFLTSYFTGVLVVWLMQTYIGFTEFPFREIGALLWPILPIAILMKRGE